MNRQRNEAFVDEAIDARFAPVAGSRTFARILDTFGLRHKKVLDLGCGYGEYLSQFGPGSVGLTTNPDEAAYGKTKGLTIREGNVERISEIDLDGDFDAVWANNLFEHLLSPHAFLMALRERAQDQGLLILGVPVIPGPASLMRLGKFRGALAIAHINFFSREGLRLTVARAGWRVLAVRPFVVSWPLPDTLVGFLTPHLYVVAVKDPDFSYPEKKLKEWLSDPHYRTLLASTGQAPPL